MDFVNSSWVPEDKSHDDANIDSEEDGSGRWLNYATKKHQMDICDLFIIVASWSFYAVVAPCSLKALTCPEPVCCVSKGGGLFDGISVFRLFRAVETILTLSQLQTELQPLTGHFLSSTFGNASNSQYCPEVFQTTHTSEHLSTDSQAS